MTSRVTIAQPTAAESYEMDAITACVVGGVSMTGGVGKPWGVVIGCLLITVIANGLDIMGVSSQRQKICQGRHHRTGCADRREGQEQETLNGIERGAFPVLLLIYIEMNQTFQGGKNMKKKKFLALLLTGAMALAALTGCSSGTETTEESTGGDASAESGDGAYKIALIQQHQTNAFQIGVTEAHRRRPMSWVWS